jgi:hypothetical protein
MEKEEANNNDSLPVNGGKRKKENLEDCGEITPVEIHDEFYIATKDYPEFLPAYKEFIKFWKK